MSILDGINVGADVVEDTEDRVKGEGFKLLPSQICDCIIKHAYLTKSTGGATGLVTQLEAPDGVIINDTQYFTSGDKKGRLTYYFVRDRASGKLTDQKKPLPGFTMVNDLVSVVTGYPLYDKNDKPLIKTEKRTIKIYDYDAKKELPTEVEMLVDLVGKKVGVAVLNCVRDRTALNEATGNYEPNGKISKRNEVAKYLHAGDHFTLIELKGKVKTTEFANKWLSIWEGKIDDTSTSESNAGVAGTPVAAGEQAPQSSIFTDTPAA